MDTSIPAITPAELALLEYLHAHSCRSTVRPWLDPKPITQFFRISMIQFAAYSGALVARGFAGVREFRPDANDVPSLRCSAIWLTQKGEDYLSSRGRRGLLAGNKRAQRLCRGTE